MQWKASLADVPGPNQQVVLMKILFMHNNFPGQYRRIAGFLSKKPNMKMFVATLESNSQKYSINDVRYKPHREATKKIHPALMTTEQAVIMGQAAYKTLLEAKAKGLNPDIILSHSGWGANMFLKDIFPDAKLLTYYEWYYHSIGSDGDFLKKNAYDPNGKMRIRMKNTPILQDLAAMDWGQSPTLFQHSKLPEVFRKRVSVLHDGVDTQFFQPEENVSVQIGDKTLTSDDEVITYVARGMESYRGFPQFMEAVSKLQKLRPNLHAVVLGNDRVAYGSTRRDGRSYKEWALDEFEFDMDRLHMPGLQPLTTFKQLMQLTSAHVYLTVPFVLSWSLMEAMSTGALIVGSDTEPVREVVTDGENGILVDFFDVDALVAKLCHILDNKADYHPLKEKARETILAQYDTKDLLPKYWKLIQSVANGSQVEGV